MSFSLIESKVRPGYYQRQTSLSHKFVGISSNLYFRFLLDLDVSFIYFNYINIKKIKYSSNDKT